MKTATGEKSGNVSVVGTKPHHHTRKSLPQCFESPVQFLNFVHGHADARGKIAWARKYPHGFENHDPADFTEVESVFSDLKGKHDIYLCLHRFCGWRRREHHVSQLQAFHVDIDIYKKFENLKPDMAAHAVLETLHQQDIPAPSFILFSGRGLLAVWLINPVPARVNKNGSGPIDRWKRVQTTLHEALKPLGADRSQKHCAAVCRVPGTKNRRWRRKVRLVWCHPNGIEQRSLDDIANEVLTPRKTIDPERSGSGSGGRSTPKSDRSPRNLHSERIRELKRWALSKGGIGDGERDHFIFCAACSLAWLVEPAHLENSIIAFATESGLLGIPEWSRDRVIQVTQTVVSRARQEAADGINNPLEGQGRYKLSKEYILHGLDISSEAARVLALVHLNPDPEQCRRHQREVTRQRQERRRRARGQCSREEYESRSVSRQKPWQAAGMSRSAWYKKGLHKQPTESVDTAQPNNGEQKRKVA